MERRIHLVSNRLPVTVGRQNEKLQYQKSIGGLATGLGTIYKQGGGRWFGWPGICAEDIHPGERSQIENRLAENNCIPVHLSRQDVESFYDGFCNKTIWPLFHYCSQYTIYDSNLWDSYVSANRHYCQSILENINPGDYIWVHDYHLFLLPLMLREKRPDVRVGFFLHIPFPSFELFRLLPWREEILRGLLGSDLIGFHTYEYMRHFLSSILRILGLEHTLGQIHFDNRIIRADVFPMGIDYKRFSRSHENSTVIKLGKEFRRQIGKRKMVLSVDRLDYTKGIPERLQAIQLFFTKYPDFLGKTTFILIESPSRTEVESYQILKKEIEQVIGTINGKFGTLGWMPIWYFYRTYSQEALSALYRLADVMLVTPFRDGMNLVAKEYVAACRDKGVLILSEMAGASPEMGEALVVNPNNFHEVADALSHALEMTREECQKRLSAMKSRLQRYSVGNWARDFIERLKQTEETNIKYEIKHLTGATLRAMAKKYSNSKKRLLLLDYDGTLVPFVPDPNAAFPDPEMVRGLSRLAGDKKNHLVIISGRDRSSLQRFLPGLRAYFSAEHGVWIKNPDGPWKKSQQFATGWKVKIRELMELYVDRTPGSILEEKEFSLAWHHRRVEPELALTRQSQLKEDLLSLTANLNLSIMEGKKVLEIKNAGVNKGNIVRMLLRDGFYDFVMAIGDDVTDENMFRELPAKSYSVKVGLGVQSAAKFNVASWREVHGLLRVLALKTGKARPTGFRKDS